jgi:hypothetical protein
MPALSRRVSRLALVAALLAAPTAALAYGIWIHAIIPVAVLKDFSSSGNAPNIRTKVVRGATDADVSQFRTWFYRRAAAIKDATLRNAFLKRYPTEAAFDAKAFKTFLMMNPDASVLGVDPFEAVYRARSQADAAADPTLPYEPGRRISIAHALEMGSVYPDLDRRNQDRLFRDSTDRVVLTARGDTVPIDPMTLNWGRLTGLSSQAHAHIGLNHQRHSDSPGTLTMAPWNFVAAIGFPTDSVESYAEANAQMYTDLSYLAMLSGLSGSEMLSYLYGGNAMHYIADVGNQIHTSQAGIEKFYSDATWDYWMGRLKTGFGLWGTTPSRNSIGLDILTNYHTLSEKLFQAELERAWRFDSLGQKDSIPASMRAAIEGLRTGDPMFKRVLDGIVLGNAVKMWYPQYGSLIAATLIDSSFQESAQVYRLIREIGVPQLHKAGVVIDFDTIPANQVFSYIQDPSSPAVRATLDSFNIIEGRGLARVHDALTWWWDRYLATGRTQPSLKGRLIDGVLARMVRARLIYLNAADARREQFIEAHGGLK